MDFGSIPLFRAMAKRMSWLGERERVLAQNVANADTPGYHTKDIDFQFEFLSMVRGDQPQINETQGLYEKPDGNNVSMDREARMLAENTIRFNLASTLVRGELESVRKAIHEGKA